MQSLPDGMAIFTFFLAFVTSKVIPISIVVDLSCLTSDSDKLKYNLLDSDDRHTCFEKTLQVLAFDWLREEKCLKAAMQSYSENSKTSDLLCGFHFDSLHFKTSRIPGLQNLNISNLIQLVSKTGKYDGLDQVTWSCQLNSTDDICNGRSECLTDECNCPNSQSDIFYCADQSGCVTWDRVCDSLQDCLDGSDECFCAGHVITESPPQASESRICLSEEKFCAINRSGRLSTDSRDGQDFQCKNGSTDMPTNPLDECMMAAFSEFSFMLMNSPFTAPSEYCHANCSHIENFENGWERFCDHIVTVTYKPMQFFCERGDHAEQYTLAHVCDGEVDCSNAADEISCPLPDRFYCKPNETAEYVDKNKLCDHSKDCSNGADECGTCQFEVLSSSKFLIKSKIVLGLTVTIGALIIILNIKEGHACWKLSCNSKVKAIDKIFTLQIFFYGSLMGFYMCSIVVAALLLILKGDYCQLENEWRASSFCSFLGAVFSFSSHGSLLMIACISIVRFLTCHSLVADIRKRSVVIGSIILNLANLFHSILPTLPFPAILDIFRTDIFLTNLHLNPFFSSNPINISRLKDIHEGMFGDQKIGVSKMIEKLNNLSSNPEIFDHREISYYGNTGLCVHNIYKSRENHEMYKILYCTVLLLLLTIVSFAYIKIVLKQRNSSRAINPHVGTADGQDSVTTTLTLKVALMIASQLVSWIPFILTVLYFQYLTKKPVSPLVFEVFALVAIPINSLLNPVFYSELYKKVLQRISNGRRKIVEFLESSRSPDVGNEIEMRRKEESET